MASTLVATKLQVPQRRSSLVERSRLTDRVEAGVRGALTVVSAPAGFGKTTILSDWAASAAPRAVAWVSLDESEAQAPLFWQYAVTALGRAVPGVGAGVLPVLEAGQPATPSLLTAVLNDLADVSDDVVLVLDDYHLVDGPDIAEGLAFLLDHRPPNLHVLLGTRADPGLPLARLRARGELTEIRAGDLRFTVDETTTYLADVQGLAIGPDDVATLEARTEGWAAALQLAALGIQGRDDIGAFVSGFAGTDRFVVDYLVDEVLSQQGDEVRGFLLRTSVLDRLCGPLCDAVLDATGSQAVLESLDRANLFVVALDAERRWYRYHHLFGEVLRAHLRAEHPDEEVGLHLRASRWYADAGEPAAAVRHALAGGDVALAADLVERAVPDLRRERREATIRRWADDFPPEIVSRRPVLAVGLIGGLMATNEFAAVAPRVEALAAQLPEIAALIDGTPLPGSDLVAVDHAELARIPGAVDLYRAGLALVSGDLPATHRFAAQVMETAAPDDDVVRAGAAGLSGLAYWASGELDDALRLYELCVAGLVRGGHWSDALGCYLTLAEIVSVQGRLTAAADIYAEAWGHATSDGTRRGAADVRVGIAEIALERGDLDAARENLEAARTLGEPLGLPRYAGRSRAVAALLAEAQGDLTGALDLLAEAQQVHLGDFSPDVRPLRAAAVRVQLRLGDLEAAEAWARERHLGAADPLMYLREFEHLTYAEVLLARGRLAGDAAARSDAAMLLQRLVDASTEGGRVASTIDGLVLLALAADDDLEALGRAVELAAPDGWKRPFTRHGSLLAAPLAALVRQPGSSAYAATLLAAVGPAAEERAVGSGGLADPLSARELEVLGLLASDLDGPEIARHLFLSLNTVRTHTKRIYTKLDVTSRRAAVRRGRELGLIPG